MKKFVLFVTALAIFGGYAMANEVGYDESTISISDATIAKVNQEKFLENMNVVSEFCWAGSATINCDGEDPFVILSSTGAEGHCPNDSPEQVRDDILDTINMLDLAEDCEITSWNIYTY